MYKFLVWWGIEWEMGEWIFVFVIIFEKVIGIFCGCGVKVIRCFVVEKMVFVVVRILCKFVIVISVFDLVSVYVCDCI